MVTPTQERTAEVERILRLVAEWAARRRDVRGVALVGSWTRGAAAMDSDVDLVILSDAAAELVQRDGWCSFLGGGRLVRSQAWGPVVERRVALASGLEVELDVAPVTWAQVPLDEGTRRVLADGARALHDPDGLLRAAIAAAVATA